MRVNEGHPKNVTPAEFCDRRLPETFGAHRPPATFRRFPTVDLMAPLRKLRLLPAFLAATSVMLLATLAMPCFVAPPKRGATGGLGVEPCTGSFTSAEAELVCVAEVEIGSAGGGEAPLQACMSTGPISQDQFERLLTRLNEQATEIAALRLRVAALERARDSDFEVVSAAPSEPAAPAATTLLVLSSSGISEERRAVARGIGLWLKRCVEGELRGPSGRDQINLPSKLYLVVRDIHQKVYNPPLIFFTWAEAKALCVLRGQPSDSIFIGLPSKEEAREVPECPESSGLRDNFVFSGDQINFEYRVGALQLEADLAVCSLVSVTEVDGAVLVAVPEAVWDRTKVRRILPVDALRKAVRVFVPGCIDEDRTTPERDPSFKVWLGVLKDSFETAVAYEEDVDVEHGFPVDALGVPKYPFAKALVAIAKDHFEFATAEEGARPAAGGPSALERRMQNMEDVLRELQEGIVGLQSQRAKARQSPLGAAPKAPPQGAGRGSPSHPRTLPPGIDPGLARQALQSGVSAEALGEFAHLLTGAQPGRGLPAPRAQPRTQAVDSAEEEEDGELGEDAGLPAAGGAANSVEQAVVHLAKIVSRMEKDKKVKSDKTLEALLDRAESGGTAS
eukprot:s4131_g6.t1